MGLDVVEFVMGVEEAFDLQIPAEVAEQLATPRMLIDYLHSRVPQSRESRCLSQRAFYALRRELCARLGLPSSSLRPGTDLLAILPRWDAQQLWATIGDSLGCKRWPHLRSAGWYGRVFQSNSPRTLGEAAVAVATLTSESLKPTGEGWSWHEVAQVVDGLMRYHFALREYSFDDSFFEDLGLD